MAQNIKLPNGALFPLKEGETPEQALAAARQMYPDAFAAPQPQGPAKDTTGFKAAVGASAERLGGEFELLKGKLGLKDQAEAQREFEAAQARAAARFTPTEKGWTEDPLLKFKETLGGSVPYMVAPAAAGLAALAAPVSVPVAAGLGLVGAGAVSAGQFTGSNLAAQLDTGKTLEQASLGKAVSAAVPQALLDTAAMALLPGVGKLFGSVGARLTTEQAKAIASQTLGRTLADYAAKTGAAMGREGVTEATQQLLERLQAGLNIADPEARAEYIESFIGGAALAGVGAPIGRAFERGGAKKQAEEATRKEQADVAAKAAAEEEAAKTAPSALRQLEADYTAAEQRLAALNAQVAAAKPAKGAPEEAKQAHEELKKARAEFVNGTFKPLKQEYDKRKDMIAQMYAQEMSAAEIEAAPAQTAATSPVPNEEPRLDVQRLMDEQLTLRNQLAAVEAQLGQAAPEQFDALNAQRQDLQRRLDARATLIDEMGGTPLRAAEFEQATAAKMQALDTRLEKLSSTYATALENRDYDAAAKAKDDLLALRQERAQLTAKTAQQMQALQAQQTAMQQRGQTLDMFAEAPAAPTTAVDDQLKQQTLAEEQDRALYGPDAEKIREEQAEAAEETGPVAPPPEPKAEGAIQDRQVEAFEASKDAVRAAEAELAEAVKTKDTPTVYAAMDKLNQATNAQSRAQGDVGRRPTAPSEPFMLDIFSPANVINTALNNNDTKLINDLARHADTTALREALDTNKTERERLINVLEGRLDLGGTDKAKATGEPLRSVKRERADLFSKLYDSDQRASFTNGTNQEVIKRPRTELVQVFQKDKRGNTVLGPDGKPVVVKQYEKPVLDKSGRPVVDVVRLQDVYDKGGPAAVEYEKVMQAVEELSKKVTTKQGNAKESLYERAVRQYAALEELKAQQESGIATPTLREKTAALRAKQGKGEAPAPRQMDASEKYQLRRKIDTAQNAYSATIGQITPIRDEILALYNSLYTTTPLEKPSVVAAKKTAEAKAEARGPKAISRTARTAARLAKGDVRKEAETSQQLRDLAESLGMKDPEFDKLGDALLKRVQALKNRYGNNDPATIKARADMVDALKAKAIELGKKTPEYKAALKEQIEYFKEVLPTAGKQTVPTKRTGQVTRRQSAAPKRLVTSSPESRAQSEAEALRAKRTTFKDFKEALDSEKYGTAYRLKEGAADTVVDAAEAQKTIDELKLPDNVKFVYAPTAAQIPANLRQQIELDGVNPADGVKGAVFPDGTVLVVGDQHTSVTDLEQTVAHELIGHYGVDTVIGLDKLGAYADKTDVIKLAEQVGGSTLVAEVRNTMRALADQGKSDAAQKLQAVREIIAHTEEARVTESFREKAGRWLKELVGMVRAGLRDMGFKSLPELSTSDVFYMLKQSRKAFTNKTIGPYRAADGATAFRLRKQASPYTTVGRESGIVDTVVGNLLGLAGRVQFIDQYAALDAAIRKGLDAGVISDLEATNANYLLRFGQQRSQFSGQFLTNGPVQAVHTKKNGGVETVYKSTKGVSMLDVARALNKAKIGNDTEQEAMLTLYVAGKRANDPSVGWDKLNFSDPAKAKAEYADVMARLNANPEAKKAFEEAAKLYQQYNAGLLDFLVQTGALSAKKAAELKAIDYVPFYRINGNGEVQLMIDKERPVRIANIKDQPQLKELVGGNTAILPIFTSAAQNTFMLTGMGLRNQAVKETAFMLRKLGIADRIGQGNGPTGANVVRFFKNGEPHHVIIDNDAFGIPAELIVRGMEGIKTTLPAVIKLMALPADILRAFVVRNPAYAVRQMIRDPLNAWMTTGTDAAPVLSSMKELAKMVAGRSETERKLMETGAISSNVYSGDERDMAMFMRDISAGKPFWAKALAKLDTFAMQGDAATRAVVYNDSLAKGMSEQEALLRTLESMNFSRRGVSPSMHALSVMIPFFNAQIQGLDVIYRAFKGDMPYSKQLEIRAKMARRGALMAAGTIAYAAMMEDDEAYQRAKPEERYSSWFVYVPGFDEPVRVPIPFEMGFLFKALPEAVWNTAMQDEKADKALSGIGKLAMQTVPLSMPQAVKPLTEAILGKSFYSGDIESPREKDVEATQRYRENTTEVAKAIGAITGEVGVSPITIDYLIRGYTAGLGIAIVQLANPLLASDAKAAVEKPTTKDSKMPLIGGLFQPVEGRGTLDEAYDRMVEIQQTKGTYNKMVEEGRRAEAQAYAQEYANKLAAISVSGSVQKRLGELAKAERQIRSSPTMSAAEKDAKLAQIDKAKMALAKQFLAITD